MSSSYTWDPLVVCEMEVGPLGQRGTCCGITENDAPCKNSVKAKDINRGHQEMVRLSRTAFDLANLHSALCAIAKHFLCKRWHRERQASHLAQGWYDVAIRNQAQAYDDLDFIPSSADSPVVPRQTQFTFRGTHEESGWTVQEPHQHSDREASPAGTLSDPDISNHGHSWAAPYITSAMLRANSVPWHVSPAQPAILPFVTNIWVGVQDLTLHSVTPCDDVDSIHCMFCLAEDDDRADERVVLRCVECRGLSHLGCTEEWLEKRDTGRGTSCCICRTETALDALYRPPRDPSPRTEESSVETVATVHNRASDTDITQPRSDPAWIGTPPVQPAGMRRRREIPAEPGAQDGLRRSARLARVSASTADSHAPATLRRSARFRF